MHVKLDVDQLHARCDPDTLGFSTTAELEALTGALGQADAMDALRFGLDVNSAGYNIFVVGPPGSGRTSFVRTALKERAAAEPTPPDWCYVFNFREPRTPRALRLPAGTGPTFRADMHRMVEELRESIPQALRSDDVVARRTELVQEPERQATAELDALRQELEANEYVALVGGPDSLVVAPARGGQPLQREAYLALSAEIRERVDESVREANTRAFTTQRRIQELQRYARERVSELNREVVRGVVRHRVAELKERYAEVERIGPHLDELSADVVEHADHFATGDAESASPQLQMLAGMGGEDFFRRYAVNVLVTREPDSGAPVIEEPNPNLGNLMGRVERQMQLGAMVTDFTRIAAGALHRALGGYIVMEAADALGRPLVWPALKRLLQTRELRPMEVSTELGLFVTESLEPEPLPADVKVILIGEARLFYLLQALDSDFAELFKVKSDFRPRMERTLDAEREYGRFVASHCERESLLPFEAAAVARIIEESSRMAEDQVRLTTRFGEIADLVRESAHWAAANGAAAVGEDAVRRALHERDRRNNRPHRELLELFERQVLAFEPKGERVGQLHGIGLAGVGGVVVGRPIRLMASAFMGTGGVIQIEREARLSGPIHSKGFLVLSGYIGRRFARTHPLILSASLSFEQLYEEVEGDSASVAELYALLSAIAEIPIHQGIAVTGAISQEGLVLPVGGVTAKVEGFFAACERVGLTGDQGVILPRRNIQNLVLRDNVRRAVADGRFHLWAIDRVEDGWPILTGREAGELTDGRYPEGTVHAAVLDRLNFWADEWKKFGTRAPVASPRDDGV